MILILNNLFKIEFHFVTKIGTFDLFIALIVECLHFLKLSYLLEYTYSSHSFEKPSILMKTHVFKQKLILITRNRQSYQQSHTLLFA
jgi:hypothetical protein